MAYKDKDKQREYCKNWQNDKYSSDPEFRKKRKETSKKRAVANIIIAKELIAEFRKDGCRTCTEADHDCLHAHHINPKKKKFSISMITGGNVSRKRIIEELKKCICLCANCHMKFHATERRQEKEIANVRKKL